MPNFKKNVDQLTSISPENNFSYCAYNPSTSLAESWHKQYYSHLYNYAYKKIADKSLLDDLIQETFLAGLENLSSFEGRSSEKTWLTGILKKRIYATYRKQKIHRRVIADTAGQIKLDQPLFENGSSTLLTPIVSTIETDDFFAFADQVIDQALSILPRPTSIILIQRYAFGRSVPEICKQFKITESKCWVTCHRAKRILNAYILHRYRLEAHT